MLSTFLTVTGFSSFYSLNSCFAAIFLSINISIALLFKSALTVMPSCVFTFSTPIFNYTSLNILNILLMFFWLTFSFAVLLGISICVLLCCTFSSIGHTATLQFHYGFFFLVPYSGHKIFLLSCSNILSFIVSFYILHSCYLFSLCFFLSLVLCFLAQVTPHISHLSLEKEFLSLVFIGLNLFAFLLLAQLVYSSVALLKCYCLSKQWH